MGRKKKAPPRASASHQKTEAVTKDVIDPRSIVRISDTAESKIKHLLQVSLSSQILISFLLLDSLLRRAIAGRLEHLIHSKEGRSSSLFSLSTIEGVRISSRTDRRGDFAFT